LQLAANLVLILQRLQTYVYRLQFNTSESGSAKQAKFALGAFPAFPASAILLILRSRPTPNRPDQFRAIRKSLSAVGNLLQAVVHRVQSSIGVTLNIVIVPAPLLNLPLDVAQFGPISQIADQQS
jgi:hypothetical protein